MKKNALDPTVVFGLVFGYDVQLEPVDTIDIYYFCLEAKIALPKSRSILFVICFHSILINSERGGVSVDSFSAIYIELHVLEKKSAFGGQTTLQLEGTGGFCFISNDTSN